MVLYKDFDKNNCFEKTKYKDIFKERLEFKNKINFGLNKKIPIHNWFRYKEAFSKELVKSILSQFNLDSQDVTVLDPFCGIGTTPLTAQQLGLNYFASDLSPLCFFVTKAKLDYTKYNLNKLNEELAKFKHLKNAVLLDNSKQEIIFEYPIFKKTFTNRNRIRLLFGLRNIIEKEYKNDSLTKQFFQLALLNIVEKSSNTKKDGAFLRIIRREKEEGIIKLFIESSESLINSLREEINKNSNIPSNKGDIRISDSRKIPFKDNSVDITITSPPYLNRYDYTRIYQLELYLLFCKSFLELRDIRYNTIRSHVEARYKDFRLFNSGLLSSKLNELSKRELNNPKIPDMIQGYFDDMYLTFNEIYRVTKEKGIVAFVVGNTRFSGVSIPVDTILLEIGEKVGFKPIGVWISRYKGNTPQQIRKYGLEAVRESIVLLRK